MSQPTVTHNSFNPANGTYAFSPNADNYAGPNDPILQQITAYQRSQMAPPPSNPSGMNQLFSSTGQRPMGGSMGMGQQGLGQLIQMLLGGGRLGGQQGQQRPMQGLQGNFGGSMNRMQAAAPPPQQGQMSQWGQMNNDMMGKMAQSQPLPQSQGGSTDGPSSNYLRSLPAYKYDANRNYSILQWDGSYKNAPAPAPLPGEPGYGTGIGGGVNFNNGTGPDQLLKMLGGLQGNQSGWSGGLGSGLGNALGIGPLSNSGGFMNAAMNNAGAVQNAIQQQQSRSPGDLLSTAQQNKAANGGGSL